MTSRRKIEEKIVKKEQEIQELEMRIREARAYIHAMHEVTKLLPRGDESPNMSELSTRGTESMREGSFVYDARASILAAGKPLHVVDILKASGRENNRKNRTGMSGSLAAYVRRREIFTRPRPNTFSLIELSDSAQPKPKISGPPDDFGLEGADH